MKKATRQHTKIHNTRLILKTIYNQNPISRAAIARETHLTRPTVSSIVSELINADLVVEMGTIATAGGKPPMMLSIAEDAHHLLCVDLGNQVFRGALTNLRGEITRRVEHPAADIRGEKALELVFKVIDTLQGQATRPILGLSIGSPGFIDAQRGVVRQAVNLGWRDFPLRDLLADRYGQPVYLANDSQAAALAEITFGKSRPSSNLIFIKIGQGIGAGIVLNGSLFYGDGFGAGEIGQVVVAERDGQLLDLEMVAGTRAILQAAEVALAASISWETLVARVAAGDPRLVPVVRTAGHYLGIACANLIAAYNIHHIVIGGRVAHFGAVLLEAAAATARRYALPAMVDETELSYTPLGADVVLLGCAALILKHKLGIL